ncbi:MAG: DNA helicase-2/ATP-dependent DNA helicase PcrA, partial [Alphaproteobacteria bacterium]
FDAGYTKNNNNYQKESQFTREATGTKIPAWKRIKKNNSVTINAEFQEINIKRKTNFIEGQRVFHEKFGYGKIIDINQLKLEIDFEKSGIKTVLESYVKIH